MSINLDLINQSTLEILPLLVILISGLIIMLLDAFSIRNVLPWIASLGLLLSSFLALGAYAETRAPAFFGMIETSGLAALVHVFLAFSGLCTLFFLPDYLKRYKKSIPDVYALMMFAVLGMILLANASDLIITFIGLEIMSICLYIFAALYKNEKGSTEAGLKYFLLGSFSSAFLLFGISMMYGITQHTNFEQIRESISTLEPEFQALLLASAGLILIGFLFKVAAFPFHNWTPDVYEGTPTPLAGFMSTGSKMAAFVGFGHVIYRMNLLSPEGTSSLVSGNKIGIVLAICALITMIYGNIVAARQRNLKRMLAYSSIAHSGYALLGLSAGMEGFLAVIFYMFIYTIMNIGAFGIVGMAEHKIEDTDISHWNGFSHTSPYLAGGLSVFLFSLAGIPPLAGFIGKYYLFLSAVRADLILLAVIGILSAVIGAYYYLRVIILMFAEKDKDSHLSVSNGIAPKIGVIFLVCLILLLGLFPSLIYGPIQEVFWEAESTYSYLGLSS